jgi:hypothetical protein
MVEVLRERLRKWFLCGCRWQPFPLRRRPTRWVGYRPAHDVGLDHKVVSTTNHHKMFDTVTADEDANAAGVEHTRIDSEKFSGCPSFRSWVGHATQKLDAAHISASVIFSSKERRILCSSALIICLGTVIF